MERGQIFRKSAINRVRVLPQKIFAETPACGKNGISRRLLFQRSLALFGQFRQQTIAQAPKFRRRRCIPFE
jgi:hypothetical protein